MSDVISFGMYEVEHIVRIYTISKHNANFFELSVFDNTKAFKSCLPIILYDVYSEIIHICVRGKRHLIIIYQTLL